MSSHADETPLRSRAERWQRIGALGCVAGAALLIGWRCHFAPDVAFLAGEGWITNPRPVDARVQGYGEARPPVARFVRRFELAAPPSGVTLHVEAARAHRVFVNGVLAWESPDPDRAWRRGTRGEIGAALRAGANEIVIEVWNPRGPPLLRARAHGLGERLATDEAWQVALGAENPQPAVRPDDTRLHPSRLAGPSAATAFRTRGLLVCGIFIAALIATVAASDALGRWRARLPLFAILLVHALWIALFVTKGLAIAPETGFDAHHHLAYAQWILRERTLPLPSDGWSMYHPPLYYLLVAGAQQVAGGASALATKLPSFAAGLGIVWATFALARALFARRPEQVAAAVMFAGVLPLDAYMASYVSNEPLHAALFGLAAWLGVRALAASRTRLAPAAALGAALGAALLTKVTALVLVATASCFLLARAVQRGDASPARLAALAASLALPICAIAGWFYARNLALHGSLVVGNWNLPGMRWWSQPGFHTAAYYLGFGESLRRPILSGFHSFADALYSSFWGDGWIAGRASAAFPTEAWSWDLAAIGYWIALPATGALVLGLGRMWALAFAPPERGRRAAWSFLLATLGALGFALVTLTLDLPYFGQAKAPYVMGAVPILAIAFALGAEAIDRALASRAGSRAAQVVRAWWLATAAVLWLSLQG